MRITSGFAAGLAVGVAALVGCSPGKELPARPTETPASRPAEQPPPKLPTQSEPAAQDVVTRAIAAHTKNDPARLAKVKAVRVSMTGQMNSGQWVPVNRVMLGEWPDKFRGAWTFDAPGFQPAIALLNGSSGSYRGGAGQTEVLSPGRLQELRWDSTSQLWVPLLVPLTDPATVVFAAADGTIDNKPVKTVKAVAPGYPVWTLAFDPASSLLVRVSYDGQEAGLAVSKVLILSEHAEKAGLMVPGRWEVVHSGNAVEISRLAEITFPEKVDPKEFQEP